MRWFYQPSTAEINNLKNQPRTQGKSTSILIPYGLVLPTIND
jgi:hypothetical protein